MGFFSQIHDSNPSKWVYDNLITNISYLEQIVQNNYYQRVCYASVNNTRVTEALISLMSIQIIIRDKNTFENNQITLKITRHNKQKLVTKLNMIRKNYSHATWRIYVTIPKRKYERNL